MSLSGRNGSLNFAQERIRSTREARAELDSVIARDKQILRLRSEIDTFDSLSSLRIIKNHPLGWFFINLAPCYFPRGEPQVL